MRDKLSAFYQRVKNLLGLNKKYACLFSERGTGTAAIIGDTFDSKKLAEKWAMYVCMEAYIFLEVVEIRSHTNYTESFSLNTKWQHIRDI